ncbi:MAG: VOC family protein [Gammaproteobacteria bacterium]|nr:VOC family protein [Gammaproteobacteria bacterium]
MNPIGLVPELYCSNLTETLEFYTHILGFQILFERKEERFAYLQKGNAQIMIEELGAERQWITAELQKPFGRGINFQIEIDDIEALYQTAVKHGLAFVLPLEDKWYQQKDRAVGNRQFAIQDPDGYLLRFYHNLSDHPPHQ